MEKIYNKFCNFCLFKHPRFFCECCEKEQDSKVYYAENVDMWICSEECHEKAKYNKQNVEETTNE